MSSITQQQLNRFFQIIANSKLHSELTEALVLSNDNIRFGGNEGTNDALGYKPSIIRGVLGTYNASTNTPPLSNLTGLLGDSYEVSVAGSFDFGSGAVKMAVKDKIVFINNQWQNLSSNLSFSETYMGTVTTLGATTTNQEVEDYINAKMFTVTSNTVKVLRLNVFINNVLYKKMFWHKANLNDTYGTGNTVVLFEDLLEFETTEFNPVNETTTTVALGDIGASTIEDYINANDSVFWDLEDGVIYIFTATISTVETAYLYVGIQPQYIGLSQTPVTALDFIEINGSNTIASQFNSFEVKNIATTIKSNVAKGFLDLQYEITFDKVTNILFDKEYSDYLTGFDSFKTDFNYVIALYNKTKKETYLAKIVSFLLDTGNYILSVEDSIDRTMISVGDVLEISISSQKKTKTKISEYWVDKGVNTDDYAFQVGDVFEGWPSTTRYVVGKVVDLPFDINDGTKVKLVIDNEIL